MALMVFRLPKCASMRTRPGQVEPEVFLRVVHATQNSHNGAPVAAYHEQLVEIALGPKGAFETGNIGALTRRVLPGRVVSASPPPRGNHKPARQLKTHRVVEFLRKAIEWRALPDSGKIADQAEIARREGITRGRVTQVMGMLRSINTITDYRVQLREFHKILV